MRSFFRQKRTVQERHGPPENSLPHVDSAAGGSGAEAFDKRYRGFDFLFRAAELEPVIWTIFGDDYTKRPSIGSYKTFHVLECMSYQRDANRRSSWISYNYSKAMEAQAKSKRGR